MVAEMAAVERSRRRRGRTGRGDDDRRSAAAEDGACRWSRCTAIRGRRPPSRAAGRRRADRRRRARPSPRAGCGRRRRAEAAQGAAADAQAAAAAAADGPGFIKLAEGAYQLPGTDMLEYLPPQAHDMDKQALYDMAERLEQAMSNYGVRGKVKEIHTGPVVTMYEFAPAPGTRTGKIANLANDLAMALEALAVRIVAPIPGKAVGRHRGAEQDARDRLPQGDPRATTCFAGASVEAADGARQGHRGRAGRRRTWPRCRTCWSPAPPARASRSRSTG